MFFYFFYWTLPYFSVLFVSVCVYDSYYEGEKNMCTKIQSVFTSTKTNYFFFFLINLSHWRDYCMLCHGISTLYIYFVLFGLRGKNKKKKTKTFEKKQRIMKFFIFKWFWFNFIDKMRFSNEYRCGTNLQSLCINTYTKQTRKNSH